MGIEAESAVNDLEAVEKVRTHHHDIVLMDIQMPEMDGIITTREIRALNREGVDRLPILAMTAHALTGDKEKSLEAGMNDHLTKPVDPDKLTAALLQWLPVDKCVTVSDVSDAHTKPDFLSIPSTQALNVQDGLKRLGGNRELYLKLLRNFKSKTIDS